MNTMILLLKYLTCRTLACKTYTDTELVKYELHKDIGQVVRDLSGNNFHGLNGDSLETEEVDVIFTDRGAFFDGNQHITLGNTLVSESPLLLSRNFTLVVWVYPLADRAYIFGSPNYVRISYSDGELVNYSAPSAERILISEGYLSKNYSDKWGMWSLIYTYSSTYVKIRAAYNQEVFNERTVNQSWEDSPDEPHQIGKNVNFLRGFLYEFTLYDQPLLPSVFTSNDLFITGTSCAGYPLPLTECMCDVEDPYMNCNNQACQCGGYSCRSDAEDCIECGCDSDCGVYLPYNCTHFGDEFCSPFEFDSVSFACDFLACATGFYLKADLTCSVSCPSGFYANDSSGSCESCHSDCSDCEGPSNTSCLSCSANFSVLNNGKCECSAGFFEESSDPLKCCAELCKSCGTDSKCTECIDNASLTEEECVCDPGFFLNESGKCEICGSFCLECNMDSCVKCEDNMMAEGKECICELEMVEGNCLGYFSISVELKDKKSIEISSEEQFSLEEDQMQIEIESGGYPVIFTVSSEGSLSFKIAFEIPYDYLDGEYRLNLIFTERLLSVNQKVHNASNYTFPVEYSIDRSFSTLELSNALGLSTSVVVNFVSMLTLDEPTALWTISRTSQYISYLPILDLNISDALYGFLRTYNNAFLVPNLAVEYIQKLETPAPDAFRKYGVLQKEFEDTHIIRNAARFLILFVGILGCYGLALLICTICPFEFFKNKKDNLQRKFWNMLIRLWIWNSFDMIISASVNILENESNTLSVFFSVFLLILGNSTPLILFLLIRRAESDLRSEDPMVTDRIGTLVNGINLCSKIGIYYEVLIALRNLLFVYTLYYLNKNPYVFLGIQLAVSVMFMSAIIASDIFQSRLFGIINTASEACLSLLFSGLIVCEYLDSENTKSIIDYSIRGISVGFIVFATFAILVCKLVTKCTRNKSSQVAPTPVLSFDNSNHGGENWRGTLFLPIQPARFNRSDIIRGCEY